MSKVAIANFQILLAMVYSILEVPLGFVLDRNGLDYVDVSKYV